MTSHRPFRFGVQMSRAASRIAWQEQAKRAEALGYDILVMADHLGAQFAIGPALTAVAEATLTLRIGTLVLQNDLRHPALVAMEAASLDVLSDGRFELGIGAGGSFRPDYEWTGIPFDPPGTRVERLKESIHVLKGLFAGEPFSFTGRHYTISEFDRHYPKPIQRPHPPILIGGGGPRMLTLAASEADIVSILPTLHPAGGRFQMDECTAATVAAQVALVRQAAGARFSTLELHVLLQRLVITDAPRQASEDLSREWAPLTPTDVGETPYLLIGTIDGIVETLRARREQYGISYLVVFERDMDTFAPVVARLAGV